MGYGVEEIRLLSISMDRGAEMIMISVGKG